MASSTGVALAERRRRARIRAEIAAKVAEIDAERASIATRRSEPFCPVCGLRRSHWLGCPEADR